MKTITTTVYTFDELSDEAKEKARDWYRRVSFGDSFAGDNIVGDAIQVGLKIRSLDGHRNNEGEFLASAEETAHKIEENHGQSCETFIDAKAYLADRDNVINGAEKDDEGNFADEYNLDRKLDALDRDFLRVLLEDYRIMLNKEIEYQSSAEYIDENVSANEYTFTETGERKG
jgi:hypothetical protein